MKPSFALDFRDGVIALLHRTSRGWQQVGTTPLDAPDLTEALNYLRATALGLSPRGLTTKLVIPNDQVMYTQVYAPGPEAAKRRRQVRAAIDGLTPYALDDVVFDWWGTGPEVQVAIVAKETLAEAEAFAAEHRLNPVAFVAVPENGAYLGEPFFGPSTLAATLLATGEKVERDQDPISVVAREFPHRETAAPAPVAIVTEVAAPELAMPELALPDLAVPEPTVPELTVSAPAASESIGSELAEPAPKVTPERVATALSAEVAATETLPDFRGAVPPPAGSPAFDLGRMAVDLVDEAPMAVDVSDDLPTETQTMPSSEPSVVNANLVTQAKDEVPASPAAEIIAAFASRRSAAMAAGAAKSAMIGEPNKAPALGAAPAQRPSVPRPTLARPAAAQPVVTRSTLPFPTKTTAAKPGVAAKPPKSNGAAVTAPGIAGARRERNVVPMLPTAAPDDMPQKPAAKTSAKAQTGLDGRPMASRSKPRYLGLVLTGILLLLLALVAAWSSFFLSANDTGPTAAPATESTAALTPAQTLAPATALPATASPDATGQATTADATPAATNPTTTAEDPQSGDLPTTEDEALADGQDPGTTDTEPPADSLAAASPGTADQTALDQAAADKAAADQAAADKAAANQAASDKAAADQAAADKAAADKAATDQAAADKAAADKLAADQAAAAAKPEPAPATQISTNVAPAGTPGTDPQDEIFLAAADTPPDTTDPLALPQVAATGDPAPDAAPPPPPFGTVYQFDADGRIKPTPEGIITPEGVLLIAGKPKIVPPTRPAATVAAVPTLQTLPNVTATLPSVDQASTAAAAPAQIFSDPALAGKKPRLRPAGLVAPTVTVKQGTDLATAPGSRFAALRPQARPLALTEAANVTAATNAAAASFAANGVQPAATNLPAASQLAVATSLKPAARPSGLNQAVDAAVAAALKAPAQDASAQTADQQTASAQDSASAAADAQAEPDVQAPALRLPTNASVAKQATDRRAINTGKVALLGVFGTASQRYAMVRQPGGGVKKVQVGDTIDGGRIAAITNNAVQYQKGGRMLTLALPTG